MRVFIGLVLAFTAVSAIPNETQRIFGGSLTTIDNYPSLVGLLMPIGASFRLNCGGSILNNRSVLTAAHCLDDKAIESVQIRAGSTNANSGGIVYASSQFILHPSYNIATFLDADISIIRISGSFTFSNVIQPGSFAGPNYYLGDNQAVWAAGWGLTEVYWPSEQLKHVQIWTVNQATCRAHYGQSIITDNMLCAGWLGESVGGPCTGDSGGPLYHNGVVVGVISFEGGCGLPNPSGFARVSRFSSWIQANA